MAGLAPVTRPGAQARRGVLFGVASGLAAITCCTSPVVLVVLGVATAAEAVTLGDTLYYQYGWWFRGAGLALAAVAVAVHLRRRQRCTLRGVRGIWRLLVTLAAAAAITYAALFWLTKYLGIRFG